MVETTLNRADVHATVNRLRYLLRQKNSMLATQVVEVGGFGMPATMIPNDRAVRFDVRIWHQGEISEKTGLCTRPVNVGFDRHGAGVSRDPDHVIRVDAIGWDCETLGLAGDWAVRADHAVTNVEFVASVLAETIEERK